MDSSGNAYVTGSTDSTNFPTTRTPSSRLTAAVDDAFVAKLNPSLSGTASLVYSSYLGGSADDQGYGIAVDGSGNAYVTGHHHLDQLPDEESLPGPEEGRGHTTDAFVTKITST